MANAEGDAPVKKGPGRPRKPYSEVSEPGTLVKRGRGRPRKNPDKALARFSDYVPTGKPRGRPKNKLPSSPSPSPTKQSPSPTKQSPSPSKQSPKSSPAKVTESGKKRGRPASTPKSGKKAK